MLFKQYFFNQSMHLGFEHAYYHTVHSTQKKKKKGLCGLCMSAFVLVM